MVRHRIMIVDDEPNVARAIVRSLHRLPYTFFTARSAEEAMEIMERFDVDVVVSDERMDGMLGTDLLSWVLDRQPEAVRILITGRLDEATGNRAAWQARVDRILVKPLASEVVAAAVAGCLSRRD